MSPESRPWAWLGIDLAIDLRLSIALAFHWASLRPSIMQAMSMLPELGVDDVGYSVEISADSLGGW